jgi:protein SCO1/2
MKTRKTLILIGITAVSLALVYLFFFGFPENKASSPKEFTIGSPFSLIDHRGMVITEKDFLGHPSALFFGFTHCPEVCPTTMSKLSMLLDELGTKGDQIKVYFVTLDPDRDTPEVLMNYLSAFNERFIAITGNTNDVETLARSWKVYWKRTKTSDGGYTLDHTASVLLLNSQSNFVGTIGWKEKATVALEKLKRLAKK